MVGPFQDAAFALPGKHVTDNSSSRFDSFHKIKVLKRPLSSELRDLSMSLHSLRPCILSIDVILSS